LYLPQRLVLTSIFISCVITSFAQQTACVDSSTVFLLHSGNARISIQKSITLADSGVFIVGLTRDETITDPSLFIARLDKFNNILFSKKFTGIIGSARKMLQCNNGDILVGVIETDQSLVPVVYVFRFTINGDIVWQKRLEEFTNVPSLNSNVSFEMTEAPGNNFYIGLTDDIETDNLNGVNTSYYHIYKVASAGNILWKTTLVQNESLWGGINAIKEVSNEVLLVTQQYYNGTPYCLGTNFKSIGLIKLDRATGTQLSSKYYCLNFYGTGCLSENDSYRNPVQFLSNGKIIIAGLIGACPRTLLFTIETDHNFANPKCYAYDYIIPYTLTGHTVGVNQFGEVNLFTRGYNVQNFLYATLLPNGNVKMQRKMEMPPGITLSVGSFSPVFKRPDDFLFYVNQQENDQQSLRVIEFKGNNAQTSGCTGKDTIFLAGQPHAIVPISRNWDTTRLETPPIFNTNFNLSDFSFQRQEVCSSISICDSLKISGRDTICLDDPVQQFTVVRNPGCLKIPQWKIDTSAIRAIQIINDTTVSITFKRSWQGYLYAYSSSCNRLSDSLYIKVIPAVLPVQLGKDTTYCDPVVLDAGVNFKSYKWQDGSSGRYFNVDTGGVYYVSVNDFCGNTFSDTIRYSSPSKNLFIGNDTCVQQFPFLVSANSGFKNYQWQNGSNNAGYNATVPGLYYVNATNGCNNSYSDSIMIYQAILPFSLGKDTTLCGQQTITLSAPPGYAGYLWQNNATGNNIVVNDTGFYFVRITDGCNKTFADTIRIDPLTLYFSVGKDTVTICGEESIQLSASTGFTNYLWRPGYNITDANKREPWVNPGVSTTYIATAEKGPGCAVSDSIFVLVKDCPTNFFVPSAFTPNDDRLNDLFGPIATAPLQHYEFRIYDRWGQQVFYSNNIQKKWDGRVKGTNQNAGTFVWRCTYKFFTGLELSKKGSFVLIR